MSQLMCMEIASYKLQDGAAARFERLLPLIKGWLQEQPGFISYEACVDEPQQLRFDLVKWRSHEAALRASEAMMQAPFAQEFMESIDHDTLQMHHAQILG